MWVFFCSLFGLFRFCSRFRLMWIGPLCAQCPLNLDWVVVNLASLSCFSCDLFHLYILSIITTKITRSFSDRTCKLINYMMIAAPVSHLNQSSSILSIMFIKHGFTYLIIISMISLTKSNNICPSGPFPFQIRLYLMSPYAQNTMLTVAVEVIA